MKGRNSRNKGANFERSIAKRLRSWLGDDWEISRNPTDRQKGKTGAGEFEIVGPHMFPFAIECKAHESFDYGQLFRTPITGPFRGFWKQAKDQAAAAGKMPMLILKKNNGPTLCVLQTEAVLMMIPKPARISFLALNEPRCAVFPLDDLLSYPSSCLFEVAPIDVGL